MSQLEVAGVTRLQSFIFVACYVIKKTTAMTCSVTPLSAPEVGYA